MSTSPDDDLDRQLDRLAPLTEEVRRRLYRFVVAQHRGVSRDEAAAGAGVARHTAKFHLDKLVEDGWLEVEFRRLGERTGPGAGRPSKLYRPTHREAVVHIPQRRYDLAAELLAEAVVRSQESGHEIEAVVSEVARAKGRTVALARREATGRIADPPRALTATLDGLGYEPELMAGSVLLHNCPFHTLARTFPGLVCGLNLEFLSGLLQGDGRASPRLDPADGRCCVVVDLAD